MEIPFLDLILFWLGINFFASVTLGAPKMSKNKKVPVKFPRMGRVFIGIVFVLILKITISPIFF